MITSSSVNLNIMQHFNHPILTPIAPIPNHGMMAFLQTELNANAMSIPSDQTYVGHLSLVVLSAEYSASESTQFIIPTNPSLVPPQSEPEF